MPESCWTTEEMLEALLVPLLRGDAEAAGELVGERLGGAGGLVYGPC